MNYPHLRPRFFQGALLFLVVLFSCTKIITTDIGSGLIPPVDGVITKDTVIEVSTKNLGFDTISVGISDDHVLGYVNDPVFGKTTASINFQVAPETSPFARGINKDSIVVDSVVLSLKYKGVWGDSLQPLSLRVYSMDPENLFNSKSSYANTKKFIKGQELTEFNTAKYVDIRRLDDVDTIKGVAATEITTNQLRIRLNKSFGENILRLDSATYYTGDSAFYTYLRGIMVEPDATGQALMRMNLTDTTTRLSLYYHKLGGGDTLVKRFLPRALTSASSNTILRDYTGTEIPSYINRPDSNQDLIFMQTSPGTRAFINISNVKGMPNVIVHRAEILMNQVPYASNDTLLSPPNLFLAAYNKDSAHQFIIPYDVSVYNGSINNLTQFGVSPRLKNGVYSYSFDISRYVQNIITRSDTLYNLVLTAPYNQYIYYDNTFQYALPISSPSLNYPATGRIRLGGGNNNNSQYKMRLHIVYSLPE